MTPSVRTLQGSKIKSFKGSSSLCPRGANSRGFSTRTLANGLTMTSGKKLTRSVWKLLSIIIMTTKYEKEKPYTCL